MRASSAARSKSECATAVLAPPTLATSAAAPLAGTAATQSTTTLASRATSTRSATAVAGRTAAASNLRVVLRYAHQWLGQKVLVGPVRRMSEMPATIVASAATWPASMASRPPQSTVPVAPAVTAAVALGSAHQPAARATAAHHPGALPAAPPLRTAAMQPSAASAGHAGGAAFGRGARLPHRRGALAAASRGDVAAALARQGKRRHEWDGRGHATSRGLPHPTSGLRFDRLPTHAHMHALGAWAHTAWAPAWPHARARTWHAARPVDTHSVITHTQACTGSDAHTPTPLTLQVMIFGSRHEHSLEAPSFTHGGAEYVWGGHGVLRIFPAGAARLDADGEVRVVSGATIDRLEPSTQYRFWASVYDGGRWNGWSASVVAQTLAVAGNGCLPSPATSATSANLATPSDGASSGDAFRSSPRLDSSASPAALTGTGASAPFDGVASGQRVGVRPGGPAGGPAGSAPPLRLHARLVMLGLVGVALLVGLGAVLQRYAGSRYERVGACADEPLEDAPDHSRPGWDHDEPPSAVAAACSDFYAEEETVIISSDAALPDAGARGVYQQAGWTHAARPPSLPGPPSGALVGSDVRGCSYFDLTQPVPTQPVPTLLPPPPPSASSGIPYMAASPGRVVPEGVADTGAASSCGSHALPSTDGAAVPVARPHQAQPQLLTLPTSAQPTQQWLVLDDSTQAEMHRF